MNLYFHSDSKNKQNNNSLVKKLKNNNNDNFEKQKYLLNMEIYNNEKSQILERLEIILENTILIKF